MTDSNNLETIQREAERMFRMRVSFAVNTAAFVLAILLTEGALIFRWRLALTMWLVLWMLHGVVLALYEIRSGEVRRAAEESRIKRKREEGLFTLGEDGELRPAQPDVERERRLQDDPPDTAEHSTAQRRSKPRGTQP